MMRVVYLCADPGIPLDGCKGASVHVRQTVGVLARHGVEVTVLAARPGQAGSMPCRVLAAPARADQAGSRDSHPPMAHEVAAIALSHEMAAGAPLRGGDVDLVYERYSLWSLAGAILSERLGVPLVLEVNAPLVEEQSRYRRLALAGLAQEIERIVMHAAREVICVSSALKSRAERLRGRPEGIHLMPNAVDTELFRPDGGRDEGTPARGPRELTLVFAGSFKPWHDLQGLLHAYAGIPQRDRPGEMILIGDGPERAGLQKLATGLGIASQVRFTGSMAHEEVASVLASADIAVAPYSEVADFYFSPLKVGEYLAAGLPLVASACGDLTELLRDGESALLVRPADAGALGEAIARLAGDPDLRLRLGRAGRELAVTRLSLDGTARGLIRLFGGIVTGPQVVSSKSAVPDGPPPRHAGAAGRPGGALQ